MNDQSVDPVDQILRAYREVVGQHHPQDVERWPVLSGSNSNTAHFNGWRIFFLRHTANRSMTSRSGVGTLSQQVIGAPEITSGNIDRVRERLHRHFRASADDALFIVPPDGALAEAELLLAMHRHEIAMSLVPMKIFLSHKGSDKTFVRDIKSTLELIGFDPWLDEDTMPAGMELDRSIQAGVKNSCACVFFLTLDFADEKFLRDEINYAKSEKRERPDFAIISLVMERDGRKATVPDPLQSYVWKEPRTDLEALREIVRALPIRVGEVRRR